MKKTIKTKNYDGTIVEIEVNINIYDFDKSDYWKQDYQERKRKQEDSYEQIYEVFKGKLPKQLHAQSCEEDYIKQFEYEKLYEAIDQLPSAQKRRIMLRYFDNLTLEEIAKREGVYVNAISQNIKKALAALKKMSNDFFD